MKKNLIITPEYKEAVEDLVKDYPSVKEYFDGLVCKEIGCSFEKMGGAVTHTRGASNAEIRRYGWIVSGGKHYCSKECKDEDRGTNRSAQAIM